MHLEKIHLPRGVRSVRVTERIDPAPVSPAAPALQVEQAFLDAQASAARLESLLQAVQMQLEEVESRRRNSVREMQTAAVELAVAAAGKLLERVIETHEFPIEQIVQGAIDAMGLHRPVTIRLHPEDVQLLKERLAQREDLRLEGYCEILPDPRLRRGDCRAESPDGVGVLKETATQLAELRELWLEELDDAQVERRSHDPTGAGLKRFPERRETA